MDYSYFNILLGSSNMQKMLVLVVVALRVHSNKVVYYNQISLTHYYCYYCYYSYYSCCYCYYQLALYSYCISTMLLDSMVSVSMACISCQQHSTVKKQQCLVLSTLFKIKRALQCPTMCLICRMGRHCCDYCLCLSIFLSAIAMKKCLDIFLCQDGWRFNHCKVSYCCCW